MHQRGFVGDGRSLPTSSDVTNQSPGLLSYRRCCLDRPVVEKTANIVSPSLRATVSSRIIRRRLTEGHLGSRCPLRVLPSTPTYRRLRLEWNRARGNWTAVGWSQVIFSDESKFSVISDNNRVRVWRPRGERLNPAFGLHRHTAPTAGVMVWGAIAYNTRSPVVLIRGTMTAQQYVHDILQPHVLPLMQWLPGTIFQQDNARTHMVRVSQNCLRTVTTIPWPARSPDLFPIEHIWDHLGRRVGHPTSLNELEERLQQIWNEMSQDIIQNLHALMPDCIALCIRARGGSTGCEILRSFAFFSEINYPFSLIF
ncbi:transposable element Tcb2 transposase [Trichonephila clavipes]|nr:transposable element Tcb2 transposase [Trichonephila clavipes]